MNAAAGKSDDTTTAGNTAVPEHGDHDRVQMLSLRADGTPDQHNPEIIGDPEFAKAAAGEQFRQQAVSAADAAKFSANSVPMMAVGQKDGSVKVVPASEAPQDPSIQATIDEHEKVAEAATKAADAMVDKLSKASDK